MAENYTKDLKESVYHGAVISVLAVGYTVLGKTLVKMSSPSFIFRAVCGTPVVLLPLTGSGFGMQLPSKIGPLAKTFLLAPSLKWDLHETAQK